jgi:hypothetical protein
MGTREGFYPATSCQPESDTDAVNPAAGDVLERFPPVDKRSDILPVPQGDQKRRVGRVNV